MDGADFATVYPHTQSHVKRNDVQAVLPDFVTSFHPDPLRNKMVFFLLLGRESLILKVL